MLRNRIITIFLLMGALLQGCALISEQAKLEAYGRTMDSYATAMRMSDFDTVCQFVDPSSMPHQQCLDRFGEIKIVDCQVTERRVSEDRRQVSQTVAVGYYFLNHYLLKQIRYQQTWQYREGREAWLLQNGPPPFR